MSSTQELEASIKATGDKIRSLKEAKSDKSQISQEVEHLKLLKARYQEVSGQPYDAAAAPPQGNTPPKGNTPQGNTPDDFLQADDCALGLKLCALRLGSGGTSNINNPSTSPIRFSLFQAMSLQLLVTRVKRKS